MKSHDEVFTPGMIAIINRLRDFHYMFLEEIDLGEGELDHLGEFWFGKNKWGFRSKAMDMFEEGGIPAEDYDDVDKMATRFCHRLERDTGMTVKHKVLYERKDDPDIGFDELEVVIEIPQDADFGNHRDAKEFS